MAVVRQVDLSCWASDLEVHASEGLNSILIKSLKKISKYHYADANDCYKEYKLMIII